MTKPRKKPALKQSPPVPAEPLKKTLCDGIIQGTTKVYLDVSLSADGLHFAGQDIGAALEASMGSSDYEYWLNIERRYLDSLLLELIVQRFGRDPCAFSKIQELLESQEIPSSFFSYH